MEDHSDRRIFMRKIAIIGSGFVGASISFALTFSRLVDEIILIDIDKEHAIGEAMDINPGIGALSSVVVRAGDYKDLSDCDVIVITAGKARKPGQSRNDLKMENEKIFDSILNQLAPYYRNSFLIIVTNPVDYLTGYVAKKGFVPKNKLCGTGCLLDCARWTSALSSYFHVKNEAIQMYVTGIHGDNQKPLWERTRIEGLPIEKYCRIRGIPWNDEIIALISDKVRDMGAEIIARKGKTQYGISSVVLHLIHLLAKDYRTTVSVGNVWDFDPDHVQSSLVRIGKMEVVPQPE